MSYSHSFPLLRPHVTSIILRANFSAPARYLNSPHSTSLENFSRVVLPPSTLKGPPVASSPKSAGEAATNIPSLPYHVQRTVSHGLPVYYLTKRGGNLHQTRIRKIKGDIGALRDQLRAFLNLKKEHATINTVTGQITLKGRYMDEVKKFLEQQSF